MNENEKKSFDIKNWLMCNLFRMIRIVFMISGLSVYLRFWLQLRDKVPFTLFDGILLIVLIALLIATIIRLYTKRDEVFIGFTGFEIFGKIVVSLMILAVYLAPTILLLTPKSV